jgi:iron(III) transport system substrate-binding protein
VTSPTLERNIPAQLRDPDNAWWPLSLRVRTPMRSTEHVPEDAIDSYADLGDKRWRGKLCLRTSSNEYNQSLVADQIAKNGSEATERLLRSWMDNDPQILGSDVEVLEAIDAGRCDVGLTNHYYLARILADDPDFPVAPAWPEQDGAGAHTNLSGVGLVKGSEHREDAIALMEHLTSPEAQREIAANGEFAANPEVPPADYISDWAGIKRDIIDVDGAGENLPAAVEMMERVGWD